MLRDGKSYLLANRIEIERLIEEEVPKDVFEPVQFSWEEEKANPAFVTDRASGIVGVAPLVADVSSDTRIKTVEGSIARLRYQLTEPEVER